MTVVLHKSKIRQSLLSEMTTLGVDDWLFIANIIVAMILTIVLRIKAWFFVAVAMHFVLMLVTKLAPKILDCYYRHVQQSDRYFSGPSPLQRKRLPPRLNFRLEQK
jgi:type IV secretory pathway VirB3-like protein